LNNAKEVNNTNKFIFFKGKPILLDLPTIFPTATELIEDGVRASLVNMDYFVDHVLCCVVGKSRIKNLKSVDLLSKLVTAQHEAFALLVLKNSEARWNDQLQRDSKTSLIAPLYTKTTDNKSAGTKQFEGWSSEGMAEYNRIIKLVKYHRKMERSIKQSMEEEYRAQCMRKIEESGKKPKPSNDVRSCEQRVLPNVNWLSDEESEKEEDEESGNGAENNESGEDGDDDEE